MLDKIVDHLPDSYEGKEMCSLHGWVGIETQKDVMYYPICNVKLFVICYRLFHSDVDIVNIEDSIYTRYIKDLKFRKTTKFCTFVWYIFLGIAYTTILVAMGSILP